MNRDELAFAAKFAQFIHEKNVVQIMEELALAEAQIAQNGNAKIILFHLEILLYKLLKTKIKLVHEIFFTAFEILVTIIKIVMLII